MTVAHRVIRRRWSRPRGAMLALGGALGALALLVAGIGGAAALFGLQQYNEYARGVVPPSQLLDELPRGGARVYDRNGSLLYEFIDEFGGLRRPIPLSDISPWIKEATVSTEDTTFYENNGLNTQGLLRAVLVNLTPFGGNILDQTGGSSITQQLAKNVYIPPKERLQRSVSRKLRETVIALELTKRYPKDQILEWYLNSISYGGVYVGIEAAAQGYFDKNAKELTLAEASLLAGIPQSPAAYEPISNPERAKARQAEVLHLMVRHGAITEDDAAAALRAPIEFHASRFQIEAAHFVLGPVSREITQRFGERALYQGGLEVTTTLDVRLQRIGEQAIEKWLAEYEKTSNGHNGAMIAMNPRTGEVLTYIGSRDYFREDIQGRNNNVSSLNSPGSTLKPFTFMTAFQQGWSPSTAILDTPAKIVDASTGVDFSPRNPGGGGYYGVIPAAAALGNSLNIPAFKAIIWAGYQNVVTNLKAAGLTTLNDPRGYGPALTLGGVDVRLDDLTFAYSTLAGEGMQRGQQPLVPHAPGERSIDPVTIRKVTDPTGKTVYEFKQPVERRVLPANLAWLTTSVISNPENTCIIFGCGALELPDRRPTGHKTGTSEPYENSTAIGDTWAFGYTPDLVAGVWAGNSDNLPMQNIFSTTISWPIWRDYMLGALRQLDIPPKPFARPSGIEEREVCWPSGRLPTDLCPTDGRTKALFVTEALTAANDPTKLARLQDSWWQRVSIDTRTGLLATPTTPRNFVTEGTRLVLPKEEIDGWKGLDEWAAKSGIASLLAPTEEHPGRVADLTAILYPASTQAVNGLVPVLGRASSTDFERFVLEWGRGPTPATWTSIATGTVVPPSGTLGSWDTRTLAPGEYVLRLRVVDRKTGESQSTVVVTVGAAAAGASAIQAVIVSPVGGTTVSAPATVRGSAIASDGATTYTLEIGEGASPTQWTLIRSGNTPVVNGELGQLNPSTLKNGLQTLRLTARSARGGSSAFTVTITVQGGR